MAPDQKQALLQVCVATDPISKEPPPRLDCWSCFRKSSKLALFIIFGAMMLDQLVLSSLVPLLPSILKEMKDDGNSSSIVSLQTGKNVLENATSELHASNSDATDHIGTLAESVAILDFLYDWIQSYRLPLMTNSSERDKSNDTHPIPDHTPNVTRHLSRIVDGRVGIIVAIKPGTEVIANIILGSVVDRMSYRVVMLWGFAFNTVATLGYAYVENFWYMIVAVICNAISSSMTVVSGLAVISSLYHDEKSRSHALSTTYAGLTFGIIVGYPFGSISYHFIGRSIPFIILAVLTSLNGLLMLIYKPEHMIRKKIPTIKYSLLNYFSLLSDPCIAAAMMCAFVICFGVGVFLATTPSWMLNHLHASQWEIGTVMAVAILFQVFSQFVVGWFALKVGRWICCMIGMWVYALGMIIYPQCNGIWLVIGAEGLCRIGIGTVFCVISPLLVYLVDIRHNSEYGVVFGLYTAAYNIAMTVAPIIAGQLIGIIHFNTLYPAIGICVLCLSFIPRVFKCPMPRGKLLMTTSTVVFEENGSIAA